MDDHGSSRECETNLVLAPKDYFLGPIFAATKQTGPREVTIGDRRYQIGGSNAMRRNSQKPALDVRHARAIFALLSFRDPFAESRLIRFSFNEFCQRYARTNGGRYARAISGIVADLIESYISVTDLKTGVGHQYRLIERLDIESRPPRRRDSKLAKSDQSELWFNGCSLSPEFFGLLGKITELQHLRLDVFTAIRSPLAQAIYLYIPSRGTPRWGNHQGVVALLIVSLLLMFNLPVAALFIAAMIVNSNIRGEQQAAIMSRYLDAMDLELENQHLEDAALGKCPTEKTFLDKPIPENYKPEMRENIAAALVGKPVNIVARAPKSKKPPGQKQQPPPEPPSGPEPEKEAAEEPAQKKN